MDVCLKTEGIWGTWVAPSVKHPTLGFGSGHDLMVHEFDPHVGLHADTMEPAWNSLSLSLSLLLSAPPLLSHSLSLKINENSLKKIKSKRNLAFSLSRISNLEWTLIGLIGRHICSLPDCALKLGRLHIFIYQ